MNTGIFDLIYCLITIWYPNNSFWNHFLLPDLLAGKQTTLWKVNRMYFVFLIWLLILHVLRQFRPTIQKVSVRFCRRAGNSGNENSCFSDLTLWCPMHEIRIKKGKVLVSIYPPSWIGTLWFCWPDFDSWKPNLGETESLDRNMEPITSDILELLQKDSTKYVRCRELLQRVFILSISYFWQMAPLQSKCWTRTILVIPATTQNFAQPLGQSCSELHCPCNKSSTKIGALRVGLNGNYRHWLCFSLFHITTRC